MPTKQCKTCNEIKPVSEFGVLRKTNSLNFKAGQLTQYKSDCKICLAIKQKAWRNKNPGYWKKVNNKVHTGKITKYPVEDRLLVSAIRDRIHLAKRNSQKGKQCEVTITADEMYQLWKKQKGLCALSGIQMLIERNSPWALSIDKVNPDKGYTLDNVQWTCLAANRAKSDLSMNDLLLLCNSILRTCNDYPEREYSQVAGSAKPQEIE